MPPQAALTCFLSGYIRIAKAKSILFRAEPIPSLQALNIALADKVMSNSVFEQACFKYVSELTRLGSRLSK